MALALGLVFGLTFPHPFTKRRQKAFPLLAAGLGGGLGFRHEPAGGNPRWPQRIRLHAAQHRLRDGRGHESGRNAWDATDPGVSDLDGHGDLRRQRHRRGRSHHGRSDEQMAVSLGTVFVLNSIALLTFPAIGAALKLTQTQFGLWAGLAIHDTSSVVGAAAKYGADALAVERP